MAAFRQRGRQQLVGSTHWRFGKAAAQVDFIEWQPRQAVSAIKQSFVRPIPAYPHVLVDFAFWQTKEPSDQELVIAIQDHATLLPPSPCSLIYPKLSGRLPDRPAHRPPFGE